MKIKITKIVEIDIAKERSRINKGWRSKRDQPQKKRLVAIVDAFERCDFNTCCKLIDKLPYDLRELREAE
jgi:hypothetical protein